MMLFLRGSLATVELNGIEEISFLIVRVLLACCSAIVYKPPRYGLTPGSHVLFVSGQKAVFFYL